MAEQSKTENPIPRASTSSFSAMEHERERIFLDDKLIYNKMKTCITQAFMFLNEYQWIANSYVAVSILSIFIH